MSSDQWLAEGKADKARTEARWPYPRHEEYPLAALPDCNNIEAVRDALVAIDCPVEAATGVGERCLRFPNDYYLEPIKARYGMSHMAHTGLLFWRGE